jgi:co-chaperonin GroES (HSP10)
MTPLSSLPKLLLLLLLAPASPFLNTPSFVTPSLSPSPSTQGTALLATHTLDGRTLSAELVPANDFMLVKITEAPKETSGGIVLTKGAVPKSTTGQIQATGPGRFHSETGVPLPVDIEKGEQVVYGQ